MKKLVGVLFLMSSLSALAGIEDCAGTKDKDMGIYLEKATRLVNSVTEFKDYRTKENALKVEKDNKELIDILDHLMYFHSSHENETESLTDMEIKIVRKGKILTEEVYKTLDEQKENIK